MRGTDNVEQELTTLNVVACMVVGKTIMTQEKFQNKNIFFSEIWGHVLTSFFGMCSTDTLK